LPKEAIPAQWKERLRAAVEERPRSFSECVALILATGQVKERQAKNRLGKAVSFGIVSRDPQSGLYVDRPGRSVGLVEGTKPLYRDSAEYIQHVLDGGTAAFLHASDQMRDAVSRFVDARLTLQHLHDLRGFLDRVEASFRPDWSSVDVGREYFLPVGISMDPMFSLLREHLGRNARIFVIWTKLKKLSPASGSVERSWLELVEDLRAEARRLRSFVVYPGKCQVCRPLKDQSSPGTRSA